MKMLDCAVILAGGLGSRLRSVVPDLPKPMAPVGQKPFLSYLMAWLKAQGISQIILSVGYKNQVIKDFYGDVWNGIRLSYAREDEPIGTGGGLLNALSKLTDAKTILVVNGDTFFPLNVVSLLQTHREKKSDMTICGFFSEKNDRYSCLRLSKEMRVLGKGGAGGFISGGVYLLDEKLIEYLQSFEVCKLSFEDALTPQLLSEGWRAFGYASEAFFIDIGIPEDYSRAQSLCSGWQLNSRD